MLKTGNRISIENGTGRFSPGGMSCRCQGAQIDHVVVDLLADHIGRELSCNVEVTHARNGSQIRLMTDAHAPSSIPTCSITLDQVNNRLARAGQPTVEDLRRVVNVQGAEIVGWILMTIYGDITFSYELERRSLTLRPRHSALPHAS